MRLRRKTPSSSPSGSSWESGDLRKICGFRWASHALHSHVRSACAERAGKGPEHRGPSSRVRERGGCTGAGPQLGFPGIWLAPSQVHSHPVPVPSRGKRPITAEPGLRYQLLLVIWMNERGCIPKAYACKNYVRAIIPEEKA